MNIEQARKILNAHLQGINIETGEQSKVVPLNPLLTKAMRKVISPSREEIQMMLNESCGYPSRRGFAWSAKEDTYLRNNFLQTKSLGEIANLHKRSKTAISKRLFSMGLTDSAYDSPTFTGKQKFTIHI